MLEKRKSPRFALGAEIHWKNAVEADDGNQPHISHTRDMSAGGLCLDLDATMAAGDTILLEIKLPGDQTIFSRGRVAWVNPLVQIKGWYISVCEGGIEFLNLSEEEKTAIDRFISPPSQYG